MATRTIVTFHPDVECDVCGRRLLRGEQPDIFLGGGHRRTVCELCAPRAAHEGWLREADGPSLAPRSSRPRPGRSILSRLRQSRRPTTASADLQPGSSGNEHVASDREDGGLYDFLDSTSGEARTPLLRDELEVLSGSGASRRRSSGDASDPQWERHELELAGDGDAADVPALESLSADAGGSLAAQSTLPGGAAKVIRALDVFNTGEHPRRVAGVARSLGPPSVNANPVGEVPGVVSIVVAWELCWYRYDVDLGDELAGATLVAQGMELGELADEDRVANAGANERGELALLR
jgi:hypothetical protein